MKLFKKSKQENPYIVPTAVMDSNSNEIITSIDIIGVFDPLIWFTNHQNVISCVSKIGTSVKHNILECIYKSKNKNQYLFDDLNRYYININHKKDELFNFYDAFIKSNIGGMFEYNEEESSVSGFIYPIKNKIPYLLPEGKSKVFDSVVKKITNFSGYNASGLISNPFWISQYETYMNSIYESDDIVLVGFDSYDKSLLRTNVDFNIQKFIFTIGSYNYEIMNFCMKSVYYDAHNTGSKPFIVANLSYEDLIEFKAHCLKLELDTTQIDRIIRFAGSVL